MPSSIFYDQRGQYCVVMDVLLFSDAIVFREKRYPKITIVFCVRSRHPAQSSFVFFCVLFRCFLNSALGMNTQPPFTWLSIIQFVDRKCDPGIYLDIPFAFGSTSSCGL